MVKACKRSDLRSVSPRDATSSVVTVLSPEVAKRVELKSSQHEKNDYNRVR